MTTMPLARMAATSVASLPLSPAPVGSSGGLVQVVRLRIRMGADAGWVDPPLGAMVRPIRSPGARPVAIAGLVMPSWGTGRIPADRSPDGPINHSWYRWPAGGGGSPAVVSTREW